jgi:hypothetical protein
MLEVRGIAEYETYSLDSGRSRRGGEEKGAEFSELLHVGGNGEDAGSVPNIQKGAVIGGLGKSGMEYSMYDHSGIRTPAGLHVGRNLNVQR